VTVRQGDDVELTCRVPSEVHTLSWTFRAEDDDEEERINGSGNKQVRLGLS